MQDIKFLDYYQWPIKVEQLYYYKEEKEKVNMTKAGNLSGVFSSDHIYGWMYEVMCRFEDNFEFLPPITIVQKDFNENSEFDKLDLDHIYEKASPICSKLRVGSGKQDICNNIDFSISEMLLGLSKDEVLSWDDEVIKEHTTEVDGIISGKVKCDHLKSCKLELGSYKNPKGDVSNDSGHWHIIYQCPCTCMTEAAFPIFVQDKVVAVLVTGQFIRKECIKTVENQLKVTGRQLNDDLQELIEERVFESGQFNDILLFLQNELHKFEIHLLDRVGRNISSFMFNISQEFTDGLTVSTGQNGFNELLEKKFNALIPKLSLKALEPFITEQNKRLQKDWQMKSLSDDRNVKFPANNLLKSNLKDPKSLKSENGVCYIPKESGDFPYTLKEGAHENSLLLTYEHDNFIPIAVLLVPSNELRKEEKESLIALFSNIFPSIYSKWLYRQTSREKDEYDLTLKFIAHDLGQFAYSVNSCMNQIKLIWQTLYSKYKLATPDALALEFAESNKWFEMFAKDVDAFMSNINLIAQSAKMRSFSRIANKMKFKFFGRITYRLRDCFSVTLRDNRMKLVVPSVKDILNDPLRPEIYGDPGYIELAVYNLLGNASKYGFIGSCIYLDCCKKDKNVDAPHILAVKNYGPTIPKEDREKIFNRGYRVKDSGKTGEGFGLFLVKEVVDDHHGECWCGCGETSISEYNIPYIKGGIIYLQEKKENLNDEETCLLKALEEEDKKLENEGVYRKIVCKHIRFDPQNSSPAEFFAELNKPTYEVIFYMEIPPKHIQEKEDAKDE